MISAHIFHLHMPFWRNYTLSQNIRLYFVERKSFIYLVEERNLFMWHVMSWSLFKLSLHLQLYWVSNSLFLSPSPHFPTSLFPLSSPSSFSISPTSYFYFSLPSSSSSYYSLDLGVFFLLWEWLRFFILMFDYSIVFSKDLIFEVLMIWMQEFWNWSYINVGILKIIL